ncbi:hypothetical protein BTR23_18600 [Alkalihalophilus pseudofirmus]|nr:hypothetical protein BTR23_18600 [Alkalihalophilus pseudofirmus]
MPMWLLYLVLCLFMVFHASVRGNVMLVTLFAIYLDATPFTIGVIVALFSLFPILLAIYAGKFSDRMGFKFPIVIGSVGMASALILPFAFPSIIILYVSQTLGGIAQIFFHVSIQNLVGTLSNKDNRSRNFSLLTISSSVALMVGPLLTGYAIEIMSYRETFLLLSLMAATVCIFFVFIRLPLNAGAGQEVSLEVDSRSTMDLLKHKPLLKIIITSGIILTGMGLFSFYFPIYSVEIGLSASVIGLILSVNASAFFVIRVIIPFMLKRYGERNILTGGLIISALGFMLLPISENVYYLASISFILGLGLGGCIPLTLYMTYNETPKNRKGEALGIRMAANKLSLFLIPIVFGAMGSIVSNMVIFWTIALLLMFGILLNIQKIG